MRTKSKPNEVGLILRGGARKHVEFSPFRWKRNKADFATTWPHGQVVKTAASHAVNVGSNPAGVTKLLDKVKKMAYNKFRVRQEKSQ